MQESDARYLLDLLSANDAPGVDPQKGDLSEFPIRIRLGEFTPSMATFSSGGPVTGFGQVKPDVTGPGVAILSATVAAGGVGANGAFMFHPSRYISASGTSFSSPITAEWPLYQARNRLDSFDIRAALVNSATNLRNPDGSPVSDGSHTVNAGRRLDRRWPPRTSRR